VGLTRVANLCGLGPTYVNQFMWDGPHNFFRPTVRCAQTFANVPYNIITENNYQLSIGC
jgi:hypothetical protein